MVHIYRHNANLIISYISLIELVGLSLYNSTMAALLSKWDSVVADAIDNTDFELTTHGTIFDPHTDDELDLVHAVCTQQRIDLMPIVRGLFVRNGLMPGYSHALISSLKIFDRSCIFELLTEIMRAADELGNAFDDQILWLAAVRCARLDEYPSLIYLVQSAYWPRAKSWWSNTVSLDVELFAADPSADKHYFVYAATKGGINMTRICDIFMQTRNYERLLWITALGAKFNMHVFAQEAAAEIGSGSRPSEFYTRIVVDMGHNYLVNYFAQYIICEMALGEEIKGAEATIHQIFEFHIAFISNK